MSSLQFNSFGPKFWQDYGTHLLLTNNQELEHNIACSTDKKDEFFLLLALLFHIHILKYALGLA